MIFLTKYCKRKSTRYICEMKYVGGLGTKLGKTATVWYSKNQADSGQVRVGTENCKTSSAHPDINIIIEERRMTTISVTEALRNMSFYEWAFYMKGLQLGQTDI